MKKKLVIFIFFIIMNSCSNNDKDNQNIKEKNSYGVGIESIEGGGYGSPKTQSGQR